LYVDARDQQIYAVFVRSSLTFSIRFEAQKFIYQITLRGNPVFRIRIQIFYKNENKMCLWRISFLCNMFI